MSTYQYHRFLDESGDMTFFDKDGRNIVGQDGVSLTFMMAMVEVKQDLTTVHNDITQMQQLVATDAYFRGVPSIEKRVQNGGFFFHAKDDIPEVRKLMFDYLRNNIKVSAEVIVARKLENIFIKKHERRESQFYADILSHLLKSKLGKDGKLVLNIAARDKTTAQVHLDNALEIAKERFRTNPRNVEKSIRKHVTFNVQPQTRDPLLALPDYMLWAVQRVFHQGETRYYDTLKDKLPLIIDMYDTEHYKDWGNYYGTGRNNYLTAANHLKQK